MAFADTAIFFNGTFASNIAISTFERSSKFEQVLTLWALFTSNLVRLDWLNLIWFDLIVPYKYLPVSDRWCTNFRYWNPKRERHEQHEFIFFLLVVAFKVRSVISPCTTLRRAKANVFWSIFFDKIAYNMPPHSSSYLSTFGG